MEPHPGVRRLQARASSASIWRGTTGISWRSAQPEADARRLGPGHRRRPAGPPELLTEMMQLAGEATTSSMAGDGPGRARATSSSRRPASSIDCLAWSRRRYPAGCRGLPAGVAPHRRAPERHARAGPVHPRHGRLAGRAANRNPSTIAMRDTPARPNTRSGRCRSCRRRSHRLPRQLLELAVVLAPAGTLIGVAIFLYASIGYFFDMRANWTSLALISVFFGVTAGVSGHHWPSSQGPTCRSKVALCTSSTRS